MNYRKTLSVAIYAMLVMSMMANATGWAQQATPVIEPPSAVTEPTAEPTESPLPTVESTSASTPTNARAATSAAAPTLTIDGQSNHLWASGGRNYTLITDVPSYLFYYPVHNCAGPASFSMDSNPQNPRIQWFGISSLDWKFSFRAHLENDETSAGSNCVNVTVSSNPVVSVDGSRGPLVFPVGYGVNVDSSIGGLRTAEGRSCNTGEWDTEENSPFTVVSDVQGSRVVQPFPVYSFWNCLILTWEPISIPSAGEPKCGDNNDQITLPDPQTGIEVIDTGWVNNSRTITLRNTDGDLYQEGASRDYTFTDEGDCVLDAKAPIQVENCGFGNDTITVPDQPDGVTLTQSETWSDDGKWEVTYSLPESYALPEGFANPQVLTDSGPCETEAPIPPTQTEICGVNNDTITVPDQPDGVTFTQSETWSDEGKWEVMYSVPENYQLPDNFVNPQVLTDSGPCETEAPIPPTQTEICGVENDEISLPEQPEGIAFTQSEGWTGGTWTVEFSAAEHYKLPDGTKTEYTFTDKGDCLTAALDAPIQTEVCGPNNDTIAMPELPANITLGNDTGWNENVRTVTFAVAPNYKTDGQLVYEFTDAANPCPIDVVTVQFEASDDGSLEGAEYQIFAPVASMQTTGSYLEGVVSAENTAVLEGLLPGSYQLTMSADGYEPIDATIEVVEGEENQRFAVDVTAIIVIEPSPTVAPTQTPVPTTVSTETPEPTTVPTETPEPTTVPTETPAPTTVPTEVAGTPVPATPAPTEIAPVATKAVVSGLPSTGTGNDQSIAVLGIAGLALLACAGLILMGRGSRRS